MTDASPESVVDVGCDETCVGEGSDSEPVGSEPRSRFNQFITKRVTGLEPVIFCLGSKRVTTTLHPRLAIITMTQTKTKPVQIVDDDVDLDVVVDDLHPCNKLSRHSL